MAATLRSAMPPPNRNHATRSTHQLVCALFTNLPDRISHSDAEDLNYDDDRRLRYDDGREIHDQIVDFDTIQDPFLGDHVWKETSAEGCWRRTSIRPSRSRALPCGRWVGLIGDLMQPALRCTTRPS